MPPLLFPWALSTMTMMPPPLLLLLLYDDDDDDAHAVMQYDAAAEHLSASLSLSFSLSACHGLMTVQKLMSHRVDRRD